MAQTLLYSVVKMLILSNQFVFFASSVISHVMTIYGALAVFACLAVLYSVQATEVTTVRFLLENCVAVLYSTV